MGYSHQELYDGDVQRLRLAHTTRLRVRYGETDAMGYVYYGNYGQYLEVARTEAMRAAGVVYNEMEQQLGVMMPVREMHLRYRNAAYYDDELEVLAGVWQYAGASLIFGYNITQAKDGTLVLIAQTNMAFIDSRSHRPVRIPANLLAQLERGV